MEPHGSPRGFALPVGRGIPAEPGCCHRCQSLHVFWIRSKIPPSAPPCLCEHRPPRPEIAPSRFFHSMENFFLIFPRHGKFRPVFPHGGTTPPNTARGEPGPPQCPQWPVFSPGGTTSASSGFVRQASLWEFSTLWKILRGFFHSMENFSPVFPQYGKFWTIFSTVWKNFLNFFHAMENPRANASKSSDPFNARVASDAKRTQTPIRTARMGPPLRRVFSNGPGTSLLDFKTAQGNGVALRRLRTFAPLAPFALHGCSVRADFSGF